MSKLHKKGFLKPFYYLKICKKPKVAALHLESMPKTARRLNWKLPLLHLQLSHSASVHYGKRAANTNQCTSPLHHQPFQPPNVLLQILRAHPQAVPIHSCAHRNLDTSTGHPSKKNASMKTSKFPRAETTTLTGARPIPNTLLSIGILRVEGHSR